jgi:hypothetical protein
VAPRPRREDGFFAAERNHLRQGRDQIGMSVAMLETKEREIDLAAVYAQKFWDAGNSIVTLMFALALAVYATLASSAPVRCLAHRWWGPLIAVAVIGNVGLGFALWRLMIHEARLLGLVTDNATLLDAVVSAFHIRAVMLAINTTLYLVVIALVYYYTPSSCP